MDCSHAPEQVQRKNTQFVKLCAYLQAEGSHLIQGKLAGETLKLMDRGREGAAHRRAWQRYAKHLGLLASIAKSTPTHDVQQPFGPREGG